MGYHHRNHRNKFFICCCFSILWVWKVWFQLQIVSPWLSEWISRTSNTFAHNSILTNCMICTQIHHFGNWNGCKFTEREKQNCSILEPGAGCCWRSSLSLQNPNPSVCQLRWEVGALSVSDLCGNFVAATEVNPPQQTEFPNLSAFGGFTQTDKWSSTVGLPAG